MAVLWMAVLAAGVRMVKMGVDTFAVADLVPALHLKEKRSAPPPPHHLHHHHLLLLHHHLLLLHHHPNYLHLHHHCHHHHCHLLLHHPNYLHLHDFLFQEIFHKDQLEVEVLAKVLDTGRYTDILT
jgi:hypothetical protein